MAAKKKPVPESGLQRPHLLAGIAATLFLLCLAFFPLPLIAVVTGFSFTAFFARGTALRPLRSQKQPARGTANRKGLNIFPYLHFF
jgi:hypothetical protein